MGRQSKLTHPQWVEIERRLLEGESRRALGREFGISEAAIRAKVAGPVDQVKAVAHRIIETEHALAALPPMARISAQTLAAKLRTISDNLASAASYGAATAHRLNALANSEVGKVDDADPLSDDSMGAMRGVAALTKLANDSASIALNLLAANKDRIQRLDAAEDEANSPDDDARREALVRKLEQEDTAPAR